MRRDYVKGAVAACDRLLGAMQKCGPDVDAASIYTLILLTRSLYTEILSLNDDDMNEIECEDISIKVLDIDSQSDKDTLGDKPKKKIPEA